MHIYDRTNILDIGYWILQVLQFGNEMIQVKTTSTCLSHSWGSFYHDHLYRLRSSLILGDSDSQSPNREILHRRVRYLNPPEAALDDDDFTGRARSLALSKLAVVTLAQWEHGSLQSRLRPESIHYWGTLPYPKGLSVNLSAGTTSCTFKPNK